jgi:tripartite ATP-independent transporter DctM subunit
VTVALLLLALLVLVILGVPIAIALAAISAVAMVITSGVDELPNIGLILFDAATGFALITIPLFILAGAIMNASGISRRLIGLVSALFGSLKGGLSIVTIAAAMLMAEVSGSAVAGVAALGSILIPAMKRKGYPAAFAAAVTSSASTLAIVIPPSIPMILYAVIAGTSVVELFVAGIAPGIIGGLLLMATAYVVAVRRNFPVDEAFQLKRLWTAFREAALALLLPVIVLGGIFSGWVTATEGAGLAVVAAIVIGAFYRELDLAELRASAMEGAVHTAVVMLLVAASALLSDNLTSIQAPQQIAAAIMRVTQNPLLVLAMLNILFLLIGTFLHAAAAITLVIPIVMPLVTALGIDPVHFGVIVTINLGIGQQTPPVASVLMTACSIAKTDLWTVTKENLVFIAVLLFVLGLVTYVPAIPMALVYLFYR